MHSTNAGTVHPVARASGMELLTCLVRGLHLMAVVPVTLAIVERDPLACAGCFPGDLVRGLMEVPGGFWGRQPRMYERYVRALRASAAARRALPRAERMEFWSPLDVPDADAIGSITPDPDVAS